MYNLACRKALFLSNNWVTTLEFDNNKINIMGNYKNYIISHKRKLCSISYNMIYTNKKS